MKKTLVLFCFFTFLLRGPLFAQTPLQLTTSVVRTDSTCSFKYSITANGVGGRRPYRFILDSFFINTTGIFENVESGNHAVSILDADNQRRDTLLNLPVGSINWRIAFENVLTSCDPFLPIYKLNVTGGQAPFTYRINNDSIVTTTNLFRLLNGRRYKVVIDDAVGCSFTTYLTTPSGFPKFFNAAYSFTPNTCGDSIGSVMVRIGTNHQLTTPLSISFNNQPFSADSVFRNVISGRSYTVKINTQNCGEQSSTNFLQKTKPITAIDDIFTLTSCPNQTGTLQLFITGGSPPYICSISNGLADQTVNSNAVTWQNIRTGNVYIVRIRSADGCDLTKAIILTDKLPILPSYVATCGQTGTLNIALTELRWSSQQLDNQPIQPFNRSPLSWQNIASGQHTLRLTDSAGCTRSETFTVYAQATNWRLGSVFVEGSCTNPVYQLTVTGGVPPYLYSVNNGIPTASIPRLLPNTTYNVVVTDANFCRFSDNLYLNVEPPVNVVATFSPLACGGRTVAVMISVRDSNAARPLSMSFDGRPFSSDTVFSNVVTNQYYVLRVKARQGCDMQTIVNVPTFNPLSVRVDDTCANRFGRGKFTVYVMGGTAPYSYRFPFGNPNADLAVGTYNITITDATGCSVIKTATIWSCVWSGDTDTSGLVDNRDLLNIGVAFGETGPISCIDSSGTNPYCTLWYGRKAQNWSKQTVSGTNYKHIDTNGDGVINAKDTFAITRNWNLTHALRNPNTPVATERSALPPIFVQTSAVREGDIVSFPIMLGEASATADNIYGSAFSVKYPPSVIEANSMRLAVNQSWMGASSTLLNVFKDEFDNVFHVGLVKTNRLNSTGSGQVATLTFKLKAGTKGADLQFGVYNDLVINNLGQQITSVGRTTTVKVLTATADPIWANQIQVYPNPTTGNVFIESQNVDIQTITLMDIAGKMIQKIEKNGPLSIKAVGTYFLKIETDKGVVMKKIVKL